MNSLPKTSEVAFLILKELYYSDREFKKGIYLSELVNTVTGITGLSKVQVNLLMKDNSLHWNNRVRQGLRLLKYNELANSNKKGYWRISEQGKKYFTKLIHVPTS